MVQKKTLISQEPVPFSDSQSMKRLSHIVLSWPA